MDSSGKKSVLVPLANGFEEIEAVTIVDILRRAGVSVTTSGLEKRNVMGSHGIPLLADSVLAEDINKEWDMVDGNVITGQACGSAMEFAFQLVEIMLGRKKVREVNGAPRVNPWYLQFTPCGRHPDTEMNFGIHPRLKTWYSSCRDKGVLAKI